MTLHLSPLDIVRDIMLGGKHSRRTIARCGVSLPTADRWIKRIHATIPGAVCEREGKTTWLRYNKPRRPE